MDKKEFDSEISKIERRIRQFKNAGWIFIGLGFFALVWGIFYWLSCKGALNEVGDFIGGVSGSLWTLAGLFFIYIAFLGQKIEIKNQQKELAFNREELMLNRKELQESKEVYKQQANIMLNQQYDNTFFNLLDNHRKLVDSFKRGKKSYLTRKVSYFNSGPSILETISGYEIIERIYSELKGYFTEYTKFLETRNIFNSNLMETNPINKIRSNTEVKVLYDEVLGIVKFILKKIKENDREFYLKTLFNNLSIEEKFLLTAYNINCSSEQIDLLDFDSYLKYDFKNFSEETYFIDKPDFSIEKKYINEVEKYLDLKVHLSFHEEYDEVSLYLVNKDERKVTKVKSITEIDHELVIENLISNIFKMRSTKEYLSLLDKQISEFDFDFIAEAHNNKDNFSVFYMFTPRFRLKRYDVMDIEFYNHSYGQKVECWIQNHFNDREN